MAGNMDLAMVGKYATLGVGATLIPALVNNFQGLATFLAGVPLWNFALFGGLTVGGVLLAGIGVGATDQLIFSK